MPIWPSNLPQEFENDDYNDSLYDQLLHSPINELDFTIRRINRLEDHSLIAGNMLLTYNQWNELKNWYINSLKSGVLKFDFPDIDDATKIVSVSFESVPTFTNRGYNLCSVQLVLQRQ